MSDLREIARRMDKHGFDKPIGKKFICYYHNKKLREGGKQKLRNRKRRKMKRLRRLRSQK